MTSRSRTAGSVRKERVRRFDVATLLPVIILVVGGAVYANSFAGVFLFDDAAHILQNDRIRQLSPLSRLLDGRRPVVDLSLAANCALDGFETGGYHAVNLTVHLAAALALFGVVRRILLCGVLRRRFGSDAPWLALITALLWVAHPLQTQSVTYLIQRAESLMGLFYLLTMYCVLRGAQSRRGSLWYAGAVLCCGLGMGSKGVMVTAPIMVLLFDRSCLAGSFSRALRQRWGLYVGLATTWCVLWRSGVLLGVLGSTRKVGTVGFSFKGTTPIEYALTQSGVVVHYLKLSFWPHPLCLDHCWPVAQTAARIIPQALIIAALLIGVAWAMFRRPRLGLLGAWFFLILSPTSSFIPIKDALFEHRMYLPLAAIVAGVVVGAHEVLRRNAERLSLAHGQRRIVATVLSAAVVGCLGYVTVLRNNVYGDDALMWRDVVKKCPHNARAFEHLGTAMVKKGKLEEAIENYRRAVTIDPDFTSAHANMGNALTQTGLFDEAILHYDRVRLLDPHHVEARLNRGHALDMLGRAEESIEAYREATQVGGPRADPGILARAHYNLGSAVGRQGDFDGAVLHYREAIRLRPDYEKAHYSLAWVFERQGHLGAAIRHYESVLRINPNHEEARRALGDAMRRQRLKPD